MSKLTESKLAESKLTDSELTVVIDLGGTHVRGAVVDSAGVVASHVRSETPTSDESPAFLLELVDRLRADLGDGELRGAVVGVPGVVDHQEERLVHAPNLPERWVPAISEDWLGERTGLDVSLANDADLAAVGETWFGVGAEASDVVYVTISTGVGAGVILRRRLVRGRFSGGEIGHTIIDRDRTLAGLDGTVEGLGSGSALAAAATEAGLGVTGAALADLVRFGAPEATAVWDSTIRAAALGVVNLCWLTSPEMVIVGGGLGLNPELVLPTIERQLALHGPAVATTRVLSAALGDGAALAGGAAWWEAIGRA